MDAEEINFKRVSQKTYKIFLIWIFIQVFESTQKDGCGNDYIAIAVFCMKNRVK